MPRLRVRIAPGLARSGGPRNRARTGLRVFHATEVEELDEALAAIENRKSKLPARRPRDSRAFRIEHGGLIPHNYVDRLAAMNAWVVTNPGFIHFRGAKYAADPGPGGASLSREKV